MSLAQRLRDQLLTTMEQVGALAPTSCEGWKVQDLAAHLYIREHRPSALPGMFLERFGERTQRIQNEELHRRGFDGLLEELQSPGGVFRLVDGVANPMEFAVHLLDVAHPNELEPGISDDDERELRRLVRPLARRAQRAADVRLVVYSLGEQASLGSGERTVHLEGRPSELLYLLTGRSDADVTVTGEPDAVQAFRDAIGSI